MTRGADTPSFDVLLADTLASSRVDRGQLVRYADARETLPPELRRRISTELAVSPELADRVRLLQRFDPRAPESSEASSRPVAGRSPRLIRSPIPGYAAAAILLVALGALYLSRVPGSGPGTRELRAIRAELARVTSEREAALAERNEALQLTLRSGEIAARLRRSEELVVASEAGREALERELVELRAVIAELGGWPASPDSEAPEP